MNDAVVAEDTVQDVCNTERQIQALMQVKADLPKGLGGLSLETRIDYCFYGLGTPATTTGSCS